jgi:biotin operon repressor
MLLNSKTLKGIKSGDITLQFRKWKKPTVKTGGTLRTVIGMLAIDSVATTTRTAITARDATRAGYESLEELLSDLDARDGTLYRIEMRFAGADPRIQLRENASLSDDEFAALRTKLERMDRSSDIGAWTVKVLRLIDQHPFQPAVQLAERLGLTRAVFKPNVRKLKALGLTISHDPGYELSPRGRAVLARLTRG